MNRSLATSLLRAWAVEFNREHRAASTYASMFRLRFTAAFIFGVLVFLAGRAFAETNTDTPNGKPDAVIDLSTKEGVDLVKGATATRRLFRSISKRLALTSNRQANRSRLTISHRTLAARISMTRTGKRSIRQHSMLGARPDGFASTGTGSILQFPRARTMSILRARPLFSRHQSMITPKSG